MQIHELNNFTGTLGSGAYLAIDDGTDTGKISSQGLLAATEARIDNIIAGPAPSAEEIVDARLGADGVTYPSLGDAIRDQFTDVKSDYSPRLQGLDGQIFIDPADFCISNINFTTSGWTYNSYASRVCIKEGKTYHLKAGTIIKLNDYTNARYYIGWKRTDNTYGTNGWRTSDYLVVDEGDYAIMLDSDPTATQTAIKPLLSKLEIILPDSVTTEADKVEDIAVAVQKGQIERGTWTYNVKGDSSIRLRSRERITVHTGDSIEIRPNGLYVQFEIYASDESTTILESQSWSNANVLHRVKHDGVLVMLVANAATYEASTSITVDDYVCKFVVRPALYKTIYNNEDVSNPLGLNGTQFEWEQGGLYNNELTVDNTRIRTAHYYLMPDKVTIAPVSGYDALIYTYDSDHEYVSAGAWQSSEFTKTQASGEAYYRVALRKHDNTSIPTTDYSKVSIMQTFNDVPNRVAEIERKIDGHMDVGYIGLPITSMRSYDHRKLMSISYGSGGTLNAIAFCGDYIVAIINELNLLRIYDRATKSLLHEININLGHANNVGIGNKYDESDLLPLLYVEKEDSYGTYNVVRVKSDATASIVKKYTFPQSVYGHHPQVTWNIEDGVCYSIGYNEDTVLGSNGTIFARANLNDETLNEDGSYTPSLMFSCPSAKMLYMQDSKFYNGVIYLAHSTTTDSDATSHVYMIDTSSGNIVSKIPVFFKGEVEGLALYEDEAEVKMCITGYYDFHELTF